MNIKVQKIPKEKTFNKLNIKKVILWIIGGVLLAIALLTIGWFFGHKAMERGI